MDYHEIGERFKFEEVTLEVVDYNEYAKGDVKPPCKMCYIYGRCIEIDTFCYAQTRKDNSYIYYKLVEQCKPKDMEQENKLSDNTQPKKNDRIDNKPMWELLPLEDIADVVDVYTAGAKKYGPDQWQNLPDGYKRYKAALFRHLVEYERGNWFDPDTGCIHLAQVVWNAIAMLHIEKSKYGNK